MPLVSSTSLYTAAGSEHEAGGRQAKLAGVPPFDATDKERPRSAVAAKQPVKSKVLAGSDALADAEERRMLEPHDFVLGEEIGRVAKEDVGVGKVDVPLVLGLVPPLLALPVLHEPGMRAVLC